MGLELFDEELSMGTNSRAEELVTEEHKKDKLEGKFKDGRSFKIAVGSFIEVPKFYRHLVLNVEYKEIRLTEIVGIKLVGNINNIKIWLESSDDSRSMDKCRILIMTSKELIELYKNALDIVDDTFKELYYKKALTHSRKCNLLDACK